MHNFRSFISANESHIFTEEFDSEEEKKASIVLDVIVEGIFIVGKFSSDNLSVKNERLLFRFKET